jgi:hypothetical protein
MHAHLSREHGPETDGARRERGGGAGGGEGKGNTGKRESDGWRGYPESRCMKLCCLLSGFVCRAITCQEGTAAREQAHTQDTQTARAHASAQTRPRAHTLSTCAPGPGSMGPNSSSSTYSRERVKHHTRTGDAAQHLVFAHLAKACVLVQNVGVFLPILPLVRYRCPVLRIEHLRRAHRAHPHASVSAGLLGGPETRVHG